MCLISSNGDAGLFAFSESTPKVTHTSALKFNVSFSDREEAGTMPLAQHGRVNSSRCVAAVFCGRSMDANAESGIPEPKSLPRNHFSFGNELAGAVHK
jgi:hypothetical protein